MSAQEEKKFEKAENAVAGEPEKRQLDELAEAQAADIRPAKKAKRQLDELAEAQAADVPSTTKAKTQTTL